VSGSISYKWATVNDINQAINVGADTTFLETGLTCGTSYTRYLWTVGECGISEASTLVYLTSSTELMPSQDNHIAYENQIIWNWTTSPEAKGYKWNTINDYSSALDVAANVSKTETNLICNTEYTRYVWAYNDCGNSTALTLTCSTALCCGYSLTINHVVGDVAPVSKTTIYNTVNNVPGEPTKCWITSNLGADHQATSVDDNTEASAGWYWQFNRMQGYKHNGTFVTPAWSYSEIGSSEWLAIKDPCKIELGNNWRIPTRYEWINLDSSGGWANWNGPWNSALKIHAAGELDYSDGSLWDRGEYGLYISSSQGAFYLIFNNNGCQIIQEENSYSYGYSVRCVSD